MCRSLMMILHIQTSPIKLLAILAPDVEDDSILLVGQIHVFLVGAERQTCRFLLVDWTLQDCEVATLGVSSVKDSPGTSM